MSRETKKDDAQKSTGQTPEGSWWRQKIKIIGIEAPILFILGVFFGIVLSYIFLTTNQDFFLRPLIANSVRATVDASTLINPLTPSPSGESVEDGVPHMTVEDFTGGVYPFSGNGGSGQVNIIRNDGGDLDYEFTYTMPERQDAYAGIFFHFAPTIDITTFAFVQAEVSFGDDDAICEIYLEDQLGEKSYITLAKNDFMNGSDDSRMEMDGNIRKFTFPITTNFQGVSNKKSIAGIGFSINASHVEGTHRCIIHDLILVRQSP